MTLSRPFTGTAETLINQAAATHVSMLYQAAVADDVPAIRASCQMLDDLGQLDAAREYFRVDAEDGDVTAMKILVWLGRQDGSREEADRWIRRAAESGDGWAGTELAPPTPTSTTRGPRESDSLRPRPRRS